MTDHINDDAYQSFTAEYVNFAGTEVRHTFRFCEPGRRHLKQMAKAGVDKAFEATENILADLCHPDDREALQTLFDASPLLVTAFGDQVFKRCGLGAVRPGK